MYGTAIREAAEMLGGTTRPPFVAATSTPLILSHVYAFVGVVFVFATWIDVMISYVPPVET
jgi:hypothetical protein